MKLRKLPSGERRDDGTMDLLQKEHQRLWKRAQSSKSINDVQATIDLLKEARNNIAKSESDPLVTANPLVDGGVSTKLGEEEMMTLSRSEFGVYHSGKVAKPS